MTTEIDWRRTYAEASGDHRSHVEQYGKDEQPVASSDPRDAVIAELCEALEFYANPPKDEPIPDFYDELDFGETACAALRRARGQG